MFSVIFLMLLSAVMLQSEELFRMDCSSDMRFISGGGASASVQWHGTPSIVQGAGFPSGGGALALRDGSYGKISLNFSDIRNGMIMFWYRSSGESVHPSRTLFSAGWNWKNSYFVYTHGWWEHTDGAGHSYFIFNNQAQPGGIPEGRKDRSGRWDFYALGWKRLENSMILIRSYRNGWLIGENVARNLPESAALKMPLYLGTDLGAGSLAAGRGAQGYFRNLRIQDRMFSQQEVIAVMGADLASAAAVQKIRDSWRMDVQGRKPREKRDAAGRLLESRMVSLENNLFQRSRKEITALAERIAESGFNAVMPNVWYGSAEYLTDRFPESSRVRKYRKRFPGENGYRIFIEEAHKRGVEIHSSFGIGFAGWNAPEWHRYRIPGHRYMNYYDPEFRKIIVEVIAEHASEYKVDGINLDYVRTEGGLDSDAAAAEYARLYGRNLKTDRHDRKRMLEFTARCVGEVVYNAQRRLRKQNPGIVVTTAAGKQVRSDGLLYNGRNSVFWLEAGWVDCVLCMDYDTMLNIRNMDRCRAHTVCPQGFVEGLANFKYYINQKGSRFQGGVPEELWIAKLDYVRRKYNDGNGIFVYFWNVITDGNIAALRKGPFREKAIPHWIRQKERQTLDQVFPCR